MTATAMLLASALAAAGDLAITTHSIDGGGGTSSGGDFVLTGTIGQPDAGPAATGGDFSMVGGFWRSGGDATDPCPADIDGDGNVDVPDLIELIVAWGDCGGGSCPADIDGSGVVDVSDLVALIVAWGACP